MKCVSLVWIEKRRKALEIGVQLDEKKGLIQRDTRGLGVSTKTPLLESQVLDSKSSVSVGSSPWTPPSLPPGASPPLRFTDSSHPFIRIHPSERRNRPCCPPPKPRNLSSFHSWVRLIAGLELRKGVWVVGVANDEIGLRRHHTIVPITPAPRGISILLCIGFLGFGVRGIRGSGCLGFVRSWMQVMRFWVFGT